MIITDEDAYRSFDALNFSSAKFLLRSAKHFVAAKKEAFKPSREMVIGTMVHRPILEGKNGDYVVRPEGMDGRTKEGKAFNEANAGREILTQEEHETVKRTVAAIQANKDAMYMLGKCPNREIGIVTEYRGVKIKARLDAYGSDEAGRAMICDLKSTSDANPETWGKKAYDLGYFMQCVWYANALSLELKLDAEPSWFWLVAETSAAADVVIYQPPAEAIEIGRKQMDLAIERYIELQKGGEPKGYPSGIIELDVPIFAKRKYGVV